MLARVSLVALSALTILACQESRRATPVAEAIATASLTFPQPEPKTVVVPPAERAYLDAARLESQDPLAAAKMAEKAIADFPDDARVATLHLLAGRARLAQEQVLETMSDATPAELAAHREAIAEEAKENPGQYVFSHALQSWVYNGWHFRQVAGDEQLQDEAAWHLSRLSPVRECNGWLPCYVARDIEPPLEFLAKHPHSRHAADAVERANAAFQSNLFSPGRNGDPIAIVDLRRRTDAYDPAEVRALLSNYATIAATLDPLPRARASEVLEDLWTRVGDVVRAHDRKGREGGEARPGRPRSPGTATLRRNS